MRKNDRSLINVLEGKVSVFFSKFFSPLYSTPLFQAGGKVLGVACMAAWGRRKYGTTVTYSSYPRHFSFYKSHRFCLIFALPPPPLPPSRIFFVPSLLFSRNLFHFISLPFVEKYRRGNYSENIARNNRGNIRSEVFLFLATVEKSYSLVWGKKYFLLSLWFSRGRRMIKKERKKGERTWERVVNRKDEKMGIGRKKYEMIERERERVGL